MKLNEITIEVTQRCPNQCIYCSSLSDSSRTVCLDYNTICQTIDDAKELGAKSVSISGGEPFLHQDILKIVEYVCSKGMDCLIYSSGITITENGRPESINKATLKEVKPYISKLIFNVESVYESTYNTIMGTSFGGLDLMKQTIRDAVSLGIIVEAHVVPTRLNYKQIPLIIKLCSELRVSKISFLRLVVQGRALDNQQQLLLDEAEMEMAKHLIAEGARMYNNNIRLGIPFRNCAQRVNCLTGIIKLDVRYDGKVYPCEAFKNDNLKGIIKAEAESVCEKPLKEIYYKSEHLSQVRKLLEEFQIKDTCETCMNQYYTLLGRYEHG